MALLQGIRRSPGPRVVSLSAEVYPMTSDSDDDVLQEPLDAHTTAHSFEESFDARLGVGDPTSRVGGKKGDVFKPMNLPGKGPSTSFPWRAAQSSTTGMRWYPDLDQASRYGRGSNSQVDGDDDGEPDPAWFRRMQPPFNFDERQVPQEVPFPDQECDRVQPDGPPQAHLREAWGPPPTMPPGLHTNQTTRFQTEKGTWLFMPFGSDPHGEERQPSGNSQKSSRRRRKRNRNGPPSNHSSHGTEEQAESEVPTIDPSVDPEAMDDAPPLERPRLRRGALPVRGQREVIGGGGPGGSPAGSHGEPKSSATSWMSAMGPQKGVKFRGGAPPQPPVWKYQPGDVRAFERYERKVKLWQMQIRFYMTRAEAGLMLYSSLTGEAEQQLEFADMSKIFHEDGVQFVVDQLKNAFQQKSVYVKRHVLHEYEHIYRYNMETLRGFINRYRRIEASLMSIGIDVSLTYDSEARGSRLLDRAKLTLEQQRMVLVGTGQRMDFDTVASALCMQFPEYRPAPPIAGKGDNNGKGGKGDGRGHSSSGQSSHHQHRRHDGKSNHYQQKPQRVFELWLRRRTVMMVKQHLMMVLKFLKEKKMMMKQLTMVSKKTMKLKKVKVMTSAIWPVSSLLRPKSLQP